MKLELISFKLCPFVQSAAITLLQKEIAHEVRYVDLNDPPNWFRKLSPKGKVPLLIADDCEVIFESTVINEFLDEVTPGRLHPEDPVARARNRGWILFGSAPLMASRDLTTVATEAEFHQVLARLQESFALLESALAGGPFFNGAHFSLVDATYAPLFMRLAIFDEMESLDHLTPFPGLADWAAALAKETAVINSVVANFQELLEGLVRRRRGYLASRLPGGMAPDHSGASRY